MKPLAQIDDADWPLIASYRWYAAFQDGRWYAVALPLGGNSRRTKIRMHNLILGTKPVDHRDGNGLNSRRSNLRRCNDVLNQQNTGSRGGTSQFKGVAWYARYGKWRVAFRWQGRNYFVGYFEDEIEAALAYNRAILPLVGEFARLNIVPGRSSAPNSGTKWY